MNVNLKAVGVLFCLIALSPLAHADNNLKITEQNFKNLCVLLGTLKAADQIPLSTAVNVPNFFVRAFISIMFFIFVVVSLILKLLI